MRRPGHFGGWKTAAISIWNATGAAGAAAAGAAATVAASVFMNFDVEFRFLERKSIRPGWSDITPPTRSAIYRAWRRRNGLTVASC